ncbi:MAG TPA: hypothetical protein VMZ31_17605 [Phycisphaerae bacterium]|nr:hypothetical protein [Phycisphaerae bacterium]
MQRIGWLVVGCLTVVCGCKKAEEKAIEAASGGQVQVQSDGDKMVIRTEEGEAVIDREVGKMVVTTPEGDTATVTMGQDAARFEGKDGTLTIGRGEVPEGFPLPVMPGAQVVQSAHNKPESGGEMFQVTLTTKSKLADAATFYKKALEDKGLSVERQDMQMGEAAQTHLIGQSGQKRAMVMVGRAADADMTTVSIHWTAKE